MILKSFKFFLSLLIILFSYSYLNSEEKIEIWNNKDKKIKTPSVNQNQESPSKSKQVLISNPDQNFKIEKSILDNSQEAKVYGIYDPEKNNFDLNMWSSTKAEDVRSSLKRLEKIKLSKTSNEILESILLSFSYPPIGMEDKEFVKLKID